MDYFLPNWEEFLKKEENVEAFYYDGSEAATQDLLESFPKNFSVRSTTDKRGNKVSRLCMQDSVMELCVLKPNTWIIRDSCGRFYTYDNQFFELEFIKPDEHNLDIQKLAQEYYAGEATMPWSLLTNAEREKRIMAMTNFVQKFMVTRR